jgi:guanylate kinase
MGAKRGLFFLVAGPAGVGKSTLLKRLLEGEQGLEKAVSVTTRAPREGEADGVAYYFWDEARFMAAVARGEFLEHAVVHGKRYGTLAGFVQQRLEAGVDVVKDIDVQGVEQIRRLPEYQYPRSVAVFVMPPSREELVRRLRARGSEDEQSFAVRLRTAEAEIARKGEFDYLVVNGVLEEALEELKAIRLAEHCKQRPCSAGC